MLNPCKMSWCLQYPRSECLISLSHSVLVCILQSVGLIINSKITREILSSKMVLNLFGMWTYKVKLLNNNTILVYFWRCDSLHNDIQHNDTQKNDSQHNVPICDTQHKRRNSIECMLTVVILSVAFFIVMLSVIMLNVIMLNVIMLSVMAPYICVSVKYDPCVILVCLARVYQSWSTRSAPL